MILKIIYLIISFLLFIYFFIKLIKKNDTSYITILTLQAIGIFINVIQILTQKLTVTIFNIFFITLGIVLPIIAIVIETKGKNFNETVYIIRSKINIFFKRYKRAKLILNNLVAKYPNSYYAHRLLANIYESEGGMRKAIDEYVKALDIRPNDYDSYFKIAVLLENLNRTEEAIQMLKNLVKKKPEMYEPNKILGELLISKEQYKEAIKVYLNAIEYNKDKEDLFYYLGIAYTKINDFSRAKQCYEKATKINSDLYKAYYKLGQIALLYRDIENAEMNFMQSLYNENEAKSYYQLAKIYVIKNNKIKAELFISKAIGLDERIYEKAKKEPILFPIKHLIVKPQGLEIYQEIKGARNLQSKLEEEIEEYLDDTYTLTKAINKK